MNSSSFRFPDLSTITLALNSGIRDQGFAPGHLKVLSRELPSQPSTYPCEIISCQTEDGRELRLFCKYWVDCGHTSCDHRGGVKYEVAVYRDVLMPLKKSTAIFYGAYKDETTGSTWLIMEYLEKTTRVNMSPKLEGMCLAARWIARFHAASEACISKESLHWLKKYDAEYYINWARRTTLFADHLHHRFLWLKILCKRFEECVELLLAPPLTVIHGEYYPGNILFSNGLICPVDWETAAISSYAIDLASLTEGWRPEITQECVLEYKRVRYPSGAPGNFELTLDAARVYWHLRWLGDRPEWTNQDRFGELRSTGERLGLI